MVKRWETEIIADILREALGGSSKTRVLHKTNLNIRSFGKIFESLIKKGFIEFYEEGKNKSKKYRTTEKGKILLKTLNEVHELLKEKKESSSQPSSQ